MSPDHITKSFFGQRIRDYRKKRGWSQTQAAKIMGVQRTSLNRWEHGHEMPRGENVAKLMDHLQIPIGLSEREPSTHEGTCQLVLPFDSPTQFLVRIGPKTATTVQVEVQIRQIAG
jgi:transcriptional regulator with XRE-family HTH domain